MLVSDMPSGSDSMSFLVGTICANIYDGASEQAWFRVFNPNEENSRILSEAVQLSYNNRFDLVFLTLFKAIERGAKRILKED
jgi:uncharacterized protein YutE (UPF0331/DUF86 family)